MTVPERRHEAAAPAPAAKRPTPVRGGVTGVRAAVATASNSRLPNEDAVGLDGWVLSADRVNPLDVVLHTGIHRAVVVAVTDGVSGAPDGERAARIAAQHLTDRRYPPGTRDALLTAYQDADAAVRQRTDDQSLGMGCTAAAIVVRGDGRAIVGNVGDVRAYRMVDGYLGQLTHDDRLDDDVVSRCLGGRYQVAVQPHIFEFSVLPGDRLLLCSDGLHDAVDGAEIEEAMRIREGGGYAAAALVRAARRSGTGDNVTVAVLDITGGEMRGDPAAAGIRPPPTAPPQPDPQQPAVAPRRIEVAPRPHVAPPDETASHRRVIDRLRGWRGR